MIIQEGCPRRNTSSTKQSRGLRVWPDIRSNVLDNSIDEDKYLEGTRQIEVMKYLKEKLLPPH